MALGPVLAASGGRCRRDCDCQTEGEEQEAALVSCGMFVKRQKNEVQKKIVLHSIFSLFVRL